MKKNKRFFAGAGLGCLWLAACATAPRDPVAEIDTRRSAGGGEVSCHSEAPTGSRIKTQKCLSKAERNRRAKAAGDWMRSGGTEGGVERIPQ